MKRCEVCGSVEEMEEIEMEMKQTPISTRV